MTNCEYFHDIIGELLESLNCHTDRIHSLTGYEAEDMTALACTLKETCFAYKAYAKGKLIGSSTVRSNGTYSISIPKQPSGRTVTVKISKSGYTTRSKSVTVKKDKTSSTYVYCNGGNSKSKIYHKSAHAHNMEGAIKMTKSQEKAKGYRACKIFY